MGSDVCAQLGRWAGGGGEPAGSAVRGGRVVPWAQRWPREPREVDLGFFLEVELTGLGNGSMWVASSRRIQGRLPVFWRERLGGRWCRFLRRGRYEEEQVGEEVESLLLDAFGLSCYSPLLLTELMGLRATGRPARGVSPAHAWPH